MTHQRLSGTSAPHRPPWLAQEVFPLDVKTIQLDSGPVSYTDDGEGPTVLFVHAGMWSFIWRDVVLRLRNQYRCVTIDFPGFGLSAGSPGGPAQLGSLAHTLGEFADYLELNDVTLVVHDLGGPVGLAWAARNHDQVSRLVLINTFAWSPDSRALRTMLRLMGGRLTTGLDVVFNLLPRMTSTRFGVGRHLDAPGRRAFRGPFEDRSRRRRFHQLMRSAVHSEALMAEIEAATAGPLAALPALSIFGERNDPFGFQERITATFPDHRGVVVPKGNHFPMCDDPDLVADEVRRFTTTTASRERDR